MINLQGSGILAGELGADRALVQLLIGNVARTLGRAACAGRMAGRWKSGQAGERPGSAVSARGLSR